MDSQLALALVFGLMGLAVGSFLNVCIDRLPAGQSIAFPPSQCASCMKRLSFSDLLPLVSYLWLRGRCRNCRALIGLRSPIVELATGVIFAFLSYNTAAGFELGVLLFYASVLIVIFMIDLETQFVLDVIVLPAAVIALALSFFRPEFGALRALEGAAVGLAGMGLPYLVSRGKMGLGDVKFGALLGLMVGFPLVFPALLVAVVSGGLLSIFLVVTHTKKMADAIPFAPFLAASTLVTLVWGQQIWRWYLG